MLLCCEKLLLINHHLHVHRANDTISHHKKVTISVALDNIWCTIFTIWAIEELKWWH